MYFYGCSMGISLHDSHTHSHGPPVASQVEESETFTDESDDDDEHGVSFTLQPASVYIINIRDPWKGLSSPFSLLLLPHLPSYFFRSLYFFLDHLPSPY